MPRKKQESSPFKITPAHALCASFVKDSRYNDLFKEIMRDRSAWYDINPVVAALKVFEYLEVMGKQAEYKLLSPLPEREFDPENPPDIENDADGFPKSR